MIELTFTRFIVYLIAGAIYGGSIAFAICGRPNANVIVPGVFFGIILWLFFIEPEARR